MFIYEEEMFLYEGFVVIVLLEDNVVFGYNVVIYCVGESGFVMMLIWVYDEFG